MVTSQARLRHDLPLQPTPFIGRSAELTEISTLLDDPGCRLLTLAGPGGIGKTRLALKVAESLPQTAFTNGIHFVPLTPLRSPGDIVTAIGTHSGYQFQPDPRLPKQQLLDYLRNKQMLLLIDNFEHLLEGAPLLIDILEAASGVKLLVTSREVLNLSDEWVRMVDGLDFPDDKQLGAIEAYSAVQLFAERARRVRGNFDLADEREQIAHICALVEGNPLALELAATWLKSLTCAGIADEISYNLDILTTSVRDVDERHRSMRAVFNHSWRLLYEEERVVFQRMAVFQGGFTREAAEAVTGASLKLLATLADKSLLKLDPESGRYHVHELLRQFAEEQLEVAGELETARDAHKRFYADFMAERQTDIEMRRELEALDEIDADFQNVQAAWQRAIVQKDYDIINRMMRCLEQFCSMRSYINLQEELFWQARKGLQPAPGEDPHPTWGQVLARHEGRYPRAWDAAALPALEQALEIARAHGDRAEIALCLWKLGRFLVKFGGDYPRAMLILEESLLYFQALKDDYCTVMVLAAGLPVALANMSGDMNKVKAYLEQSLELARRIDSQYQQVYSLLNLAYVAWFMGDYAQAKSNYLEAAAVCRRFNNRYWASFATDKLAILDFLGGEFEKARDIWEENVQLARDISRVWLDYTTHMMGVISLMEADYAEARKRFDESRKAVPPTPDYQALLDQREALAACGLGDFESARKYTQAALEYAASGLLGLMTENLPTAAMVLAHEGQPERAIEVLALATTHPKSARGWIEKLLLFIDFRAKMKAELGPDTYHAAWERGTHLDLETTVRQLLDETMDDIRHLANQKLTEPLSPREFEVLECILSGMSNADIAANLVISMNTLKTHITRLYSKLGVENRAQAILMARDLGLDVS